MMKNYKSFVGIALLLSTVTVFAQEEPVDAVATTAIVAEEGVPGGAIVNTVELAAKVIEIDQEARTAVLQIPSGATMPITVGPEVINFDQIKVGDTVLAIVTEGLVIHMAGEDSAKDDGVSGGAILAAKGAMPGAIVAETVRMTATVTAIDVEARTATMKFEDGRTKTVLVRPDIDLSQRKVGEKVVFEMTQMVALSVEKQ
jgi:uncharacterized protein YcfJ